MYSKNPTSGCALVSGVARRAQGERGRETKPIWHYSRWLQLLRNPCPALRLYCKEQVLSWTQEREERQKGEGRRRGAALTDPLSPETATDWNHRLWDDPLARQTHPKHWRTLSVSFSPRHSSTFCSKAQAGMHMRWCSALLQLSAWGLCLFGTSLSLSGSIAEWLHNVPYHFHQIQRCIWVRITHTPHWLPSHI